MLMSDKWIREKAISEGMIEPFVPKNEGKGEKISYGLSSYGYDARLAPLYKKYSKGAIIDPKLDNQKNFIESSLQKEHFIIEPLTAILSMTVEYFKIPKNITAICLGKSTYARCGIIVNTTPLEAGWEGRVTLEIFNSSSCPVYLYPYEGICQFLFLSGNEDCLTSYKDKNGKYMYQNNITLPRL